MKIYNVKKTINAVELAKIFETKIDCQCTVYMDTIQIEYPKKNIELDESLLTNNKIISYYKSQIEVEYENGETILCVIYSVKPFLFFSMIFVFISFFVWLFQDIIKGDIVAIVVMIIITLIVCLNLIVGKQKFIKKIESIIYNITE